MAREKKPRYKGILIEPMPLDPAAWSDDAPAEVQASARLEALSMLLDRVAALFKEFGLSAKQPDAWMLLALGLAQRHVRGFQFATGKVRRRGRRVSAKGLALNLRLVANMKDLIDSSGCSIVEAADLVRTKLKLKESKTVLAAKYRRLTKEAGNGEKPRVRNVGQQLLDFINDLRK